MLSRFAGSRTASSVHRALTSLALARSPPPPMPSFCYPPLSSARRVHYSPFTGVVVQQREQVLQAAEPVPPEGISREPLPLPKLNEEMRLNPPPLSDAKAPSLQPELIFNAAWRHLVAKFGIENLIFPKEIIFLAGAPGSGKGTMASDIMQARDLPGVIEMSKLLEGEKAEAMKKEGKLIGDREVVEAMLEALLMPMFREGAGAIVDGFPRTMVQAQIIKLLSEKMNLVRAEYRNHPVLRNLFRRPIFRIAVLYVEEEESVRRQLRRGQANLAFNVAALNAPPFNRPKLKEIRDTDQSETLARERYRLFKVNVYEALQAIKDSFHFHYIPADGPPDEVRNRILGEFVYQSSLELGDDTYQKVRVIPSAAHIVRHARQHMVQRLDGYARNHPDLFNRVLQLIEQDFVAIIQRQSLAGKAIIRSMSPIFEDKQAIHMILDVLSERGYFVTLDVQKVSVPSHVVPSKLLCVWPADSPPEIVCRIDCCWVFSIKFPRPMIRRGQ